MLLCEVQLGHIPYNRTGGSSIGKIGSQLGRMDYDWTDAGSINQNLEGVRMVSLNTMQSFLNISLILRVFSRMLSILIVAFMNVLNMWLATVHHRLNTDT